MRTYVLATLLCVMTACASDDEATRSAPVTATTLRMADWNIQVNGEGTDGRTDLTRTYATLRAKAADVDIITCNECYASTISSFATRLSNDTGVTWYPANFDVGSHNHSGVWSRYRFVSTPVVHSYSVPASMDDGPKTAGEVDIDVNGRAVHLVVTRLCSPCGGGVRATQAQELVTWAAGFGEPRIIAGDFNDNPGASSTSTMAAAYVDSYRQAQADHTATAYTDNPSGHTHGCNSIDYIWLSAGATGVSLLDATVPDLRATPLSNPNSAVTEKVGCSDDYGVRPSDHNMVKASFLVGTAAPAQLPAGWTAADVGAVGQAGSTSYAGGAFTIDAGGTSVYSTADAFHFVYQPWTGDGSIVARVDAIAANGGSDAGAGVMFRETLAADSRLATTLVFSSTKAKFRTRSSPGADVASTGPGSGSGAPRWVKLVRTGNHFDGYTSSDGAGWTAIGNADVVMPETLWIGLAGFREGNFTGATAQMTISNVAFASPGVASPWRTGDIGADDVAGTTSSSAGTYTLDAGGTWIWSTADAYRTVYQPWRGDATLIADVTSLSSGGGTDAAAGVVLRDGLGASAPVVTMLVFASGKAKFRWRGADGAAITSATSIGPSSGTAPPRWVKLVRTGDHFAGYVSTDGASWGSPIGTVDQSLPTDLEAGIAAVREGNPGSTRAHAVVTALSLN